MNVLKFDSQTPLSEIVAQTEEGVLFFHYHDHIGSVQLINSSLLELAKNKVKHFYLELHQNWNEALREHFHQGKSENLSKCINRLGDPTEKVNIENLIKKIHEAGIEIFAVDPGTYLVSHEGLIGNQEKSKRMVDARLKLDADIQANIQDCTSRLSKEKGEKFVGLFGNMHVGIAKHFKVPAVCFMSYERIDEGSFYNIHPSKLIVKTDEERKHVDLFDLFIMALPDLEDSIDYTKEHKGYGIKFFNQLLEKLQIPIECKGYAHTKSSQVDAVAIIPFKDSAIVWGKLVKLLDGVSKRIDLQIELDRSLIIFENIEEKTVKERILKALYQNE